MQTEQQVNPENSAGTTENVEQAPTIKTIEEQEGHLRQMSEFQANVFAQVVEIQLRKFTRILSSSNGVTQLQKKQAETALIEAVKYALDFGVETTGAKIRDKGTVHAGITNELAAALIKAMDNRTLLLAMRMQQEEKFGEDALSVGQMNVELNNNESIETQGENNVNENA